MVSKNGIILNQKDILKHLDIESQEKLIKPLRIEFLQNCPEILKNRQIEQILDECNYSAIKQNEQSLLKQKKQKQQIEKIDEQNLLETEKSILSSLLKSKSSSQSFENQLNKVTGKKKWVEEQSTTIIDNYFQHGFNNDAQLIIDDAQNQLENIEKTYQKIKSYQNISDSSVQEQLVQLEIDKLENSMEKSILNQFNSQSSSQLSSQLQDSTILEQSILKVSQLGFDN
ncbi:hypothetical protein PPERSA_03463 [Pseudocohnilembus persalinus]|uniref:Uncharacterized protein n=1 Tax=Pseudocohnilembus persalinus TaxID=266149 RepID=A0A0V0QBQ6_PSEPJ|nr:hypothetical protein PPERSA_03463 [Pseudocohnilembus persalinus]|eukprot:KRW99662.1 hypothetical protein PPERSA_03463 [Pseudocohnilembus persalinus]